MDAGLDEDQAELAVLVFAVALEVLADGDGLSIQVSTCDKMETGYRIEGHRPS